MPGEKTVDISIGARLDRLDGALREAFTRFEKFNKAVQNSQKKEPEVAAQGTFKLGESLGNLAKGVVTLEALRGGLQSIATFAENADRGVMGIVEALEKLPFGIGGAIEGFKRILGVVTGIGKETENLDNFDKAQKKADAAAAERGKAFQDTNKTLKQMAVGDDKSFDAQYAAAVDKINQVTNAGLDKANKALATELEKKTTPVGSNDPRVIAEMKKLHDNDPTMGMGGMYNGSQTRAMDEERIIKRIQAEDDRRAAETLSAGHANRVKQTRGLQTEAIARAGYDIVQDIIDKAMQDADAAGRDTLQREEQAKERADAVRKAAMEGRAEEYDMQQRAMKQAESEMKQRASQIESQRLNPTEVSAQYSGIKEDKTSRIQEQQLKVQEESARILKDMLSEAQKKQDFINAGFDG